MRHILLGIFVCAAGIASAAAPPNDRFANRILITGTNVTVTGSNTSANKEGGEPDHAGNAGGSSVWWRWVAPTNGDVTITTDGSTNALEGPLDTLLAVYTGSTMSSLAVVASNDDHGVLVTSRVRFKAIRNVEYQIAVDGFDAGEGAASGNIALALVFISEPIPRPPNDNFAARALLTGTSVVVSGSNTNATREPGEPFHAENLGDTSVWWTWTAPARSVLRISTEGSGLDTMLAIYSGSSVSSLTELASSDDIDPANGILTSTLFFEASAGQTLQIAVDGFDGAVGPITLRIEPVAPMLSAPTSLADGRFQFTFNGDIGAVYEIQASRDLQDWMVLSTVTNTGVPRIFVDAAAASMDHRFYRARFVLP